MKTQLIKLEDFNIIVSDEEIKEGDLYYDPRNIIEKAPNDSNFYFLNDAVFKKIIASDNPEHNLPSIDYNGLEEHLGIDVEKLALEYKNSLSTILQKTNGEFSEQDFIEGFKKAQKLNDKKFSLEDINYAMEQLRKVSKGERDGMFLTFKDFLNESINQSKVFDIEVDSYVNNGMSTLDIDDDSPYEYKPKPIITDNKIKIVKVL